MHKPMMVTINARPEGPKGQSHVREGVGSVHPFHLMRPKGPTGGLILSHLRRSGRGLGRWCAHALIRRGGWLLPVAPSALSNDFFVGPGW